MAGALASGRVDRTEARGGKREQDRGSFGHRLIYPLAADQPGPDQMPGVPSVDGGTRRAAGLTSGSTGLEKHAVGESTRREDSHPFVTRAGDDGAPEADGMAAPAAALALGGEAVELIRPESPTDSPHRFPIVGKQVRWRHDEQGAPTL